MPWIGKMDALGRGWGKAGAAALAFSGTPGAATQGVAFNFTPTIYGGTGPYTVTLLSGALPTGTSLNGTTGAVTGSPSATGTSSGVLRVTDSAGTPAHVDLAFSIVVSAVLAVTGSPGTAATAGSGYSFTPGTTGGRGTIVWSIANKPAWAAFDTSTGALTGTPSGAETDAAINITATDADGRTASTGAFTITVGAAAGPVPVNSVAPALSGIQTQGQTLTTSTGTWSNSPTGYTYQWKRAGSNIFGATASTYVLVSGDVGQAITCAVTASNGNGPGTPAVSNSVTPNATLTISGSPGTTGTAGAAYSFTPTAAGGHTPRAFSLSGSIGSSGLSFNTSTGALTATTLGAAATYGPYTITVTDADGLTASLGAFSIVVSAAVTGTTFDAAQFVVADAFGHDWAGLSTDKLTATFKNGVSGTAAVASIGPVVGLCRFEMQIPASGAGPNGFGLVGASTKSGGGGVYANADALGTQWNGSVYQSYSALGSHGLTNTPGSWVGVEIDVANKNIYFVQDGGSRVGPFSYAGVSVPGTMYPAVELSSGQGANSAAKANFSAPWNTTATPGYGGIS